MPYPGITDPAMIEKMDKCVEDVMGQGHDKSSATAICHESIVKGKELLQAIKEHAAAADNEELTDAELHTIDRLYLDVQAGKIRLADLDEPDAVAGKAVNNNPRGTPNGGSPTPGGGTAARTGGKEEKCVLHIKKMGMGEEAAHRICRHALKGPTEKEQAGQFTVHKQADGKYRWTIVSSSSFQDRDGEIVSQKALEEDTEHMNATKEYGTLDWWHTPVRLGVCDFSAMHGRLSVESGTFDNDFIAERLAEHTNGLAASRSFRHSVTEPDASGVYSHIRTFARAILPRGKESNLLTQVAIAPKGENMLQDKIKELKALFGGNKAAEEHVDALLAQAAEAEKSADAAGIAHKEAEPAALATPPAPEAPAAPEPEKAASKEAPAWFLADMKPEEFGALVGKAMNESQAAMMDKMATMLKEMQGMMAQMMDASGKAQAKEFAAIAEKQALLEKQVAELNGLTPRGFRPSRAPETVTDKTVKQPGDDPYLSQFVNGFVLGTPAAPQP
jgi:hypothetical protein